MRKFTTIVVVAMLVAVFAVGSFHNAPTAHAGFPCQSNVGWVTVKDTGISDVQQSAYDVRVILQAWEDTVFGTFCGQYRTIGDWHMISDANVAGSVEVLHDNFTRTGDGAGGGFGVAGSDIWLYGNPVTVSSFCGAYAEFAYTETDLLGPVFGTSKSC